MLDALRRGANSWILKPLLMLLVLAFIVWGIADVFTGTRTGALANACGAEVSVDEYQRTYGLVLDNIGRRLGQRPTAEEARRRGLDRAILNDLINQTCIDQYAKSLGLSLSDKALVANIEKDTNFLGPDGKFDRQLLNGFLREIGYGERSFLELRRRAELREQLVQSMFGNVPVPQALVDSVHTWREQTRTVQYFTIDPAKLPPLGKPDEAKLKQTYEAHKQRFMAPEYRNLGVLAITRAAAKSRVAITDEELRKSYEADKAARVIPERRHVLQISFKDKAAAEAAAKSIAAGKSFAEAAKEHGASERDIDLGVVTQSQLIDPAVAKAAFALEKDKVSEPVTGRFSTVLLKVTEIEPGKTRTFEEMKEEIREKLANANVSNTLRKLLDGVDDGRAAGKSLKEIAEQIKVDYIEVPSTDRLGLKPDGTKAYEGPDPAVILRAGFAGHVGIEGEVTDLPDGGYAWVDVLNVTPTKQKPFEAVRADVEKLWGDLERQSQLDTMAKSLIERADKGEPLAKLAVEAGGKLATSKPFKRYDQEPGVPRTVQQQAFTLGLGARSIASTDDGKSRVVFRLVKIENPAPATKEQTEGIVQNLRSGLQQDQLQAFVGALRDQLGVSIDEAVLQRTTSSSDIR
ncbi:MAG: SurA N-terminal domain-containing protein [Hyphomicrobiaceae bacterium]